VKTPWAYCPGGKALKTEYRCEREPSLGYLSQQSDDQKRSKYNERRLPQGQQALYDELVY